MSTVAERWMMQGFEEGVEEGIEQGIERGELRKQKANVIAVLKFRFGVVPQTIQKQINDRSDMIALESLFQLALAAQSLKEFAEEL